MLYRMNAGSPIFGLRREIDRLFDDTFARDGSSWTPAVDIKETSGEIRLELELPGLRPEDVDITAENGLLTVRGEKRAERKEGDDSRYQVVERTYGTFMRTFQLPQGLDEEQIRADFDSGVLTLHLPKTALPQPKRIQISANGQKQQGAVGTGKGSGQEVEANNTRPRSAGKGASDSTPARERDGAMAGQNR